MVALREVVGMARPHPGDLPARRGLWTWRGTRATRPTLPGDVHAYKYCEKLYHDAVSEPHGPIKISSNRQIALPKALMERIRLEPGDSVYVMQADRESGALVVVPVERVAEWIRLGRLRERHLEGGKVKETRDDG